MNTHPMKLVTRVCEASATVALTRLLRETGAHVYPLLGGVGAGSRGRRLADLPETANLQIEVILQPEAAATLLTRLGQELFPRYGMIAFESDVRVLRKDKF